MVLDERTLNGLRIVFPIPELSLALCYGLALSDSARFSAGFLDDLGKTFIFEFLVLGMTMVVVIIANFVADNRREAPWLILLGLLLGGSFALAYGGVLGIWFPFLSAASLAGKEVGEALARHARGESAAKPDEAVVGTLFHRVLPRALLWWAVVFLVLAGSDEATKGAALIEGDHGVAINPAHEHDLLRAGLIYFAAAGCLELLLWGWHWVAPARGRPRP